VFIKKILLDSSYMVLTIFNNISKYKKFLNAIIRTKNIFKYNFLYNIQKNKITIAQ